MQCIPGSKFIRLTVCAAIGLVVLFYDHCLTFADEVEYIWPAPTTYAKYTFLLNRYTVLGTLLAVAYGAYDEGL